MRTISVVIPTFNRADLLPATLDAVLAQTCPAFEVIVIDDGSTDDTSSVVAGYSPRVVYRRIPNGGDLAARNSGLAAAQGELVAFCDSDDLWRPTMLAQVQALWKAEPGLRSAFANFQILRDGVWEPRDKFAQAPDGFWRGLRHLSDSMAIFDEPIVQRLIEFQPCFPSCLVVQAAFLRSIGGWDESVGRTVGTDFATMLHLAEYPPIGVVLSPMVGIRKHAANFSGDVQAMNLGDAAILEHVLARRPSLQPYTGQITASIRKRRAAALDTAFAREDYASVRCIHALLPPGGVGRVARIKVMVASLPKPLRDVAGAALLRLGSLRGSMRGS